jgi:hypothetical protein
MGSDEESGAEVEEVEEESDAEFCDRTSWAVCHNTGDVSSQTWQLAGQQKVGLLATIFSPLATSRAHH